MTFIGKNGEMTLPGMGEVFSTNYYSTSQTDCQENGTIGPKQKCQATYNLPYSHFDDDFLLIFYYDNYGDDLPVKYRIYEAASSEIIEKTQERLEQEQSSNTVRVMDMCAARNLSPIIVNPDDEIVVFNGWLAKTKDQVQDYIDNVILDITLDGIQLSMSESSGIILDYDDHGIVEGYDVFFEENIGSLEKGSHLVETNISWKQKIFDGWDYYGPGSKNESITSFCEIIVQDKETDTSSDNIDEKSSYEDCHQILFISETIPDGSVFSPGETFTKTWTFKNSSPCTFTPEFTIRLTDGTLMGDERYSILEFNVEPGDLFTVSLDLTAPEKEGTYVGQWEIFDPEGFSLGGKLFSEIIVE